MYQCVASSMTPFEFEDQIYSTAELPLVLNYKNFTFEGCENPEYSYSIQISTDGVNFYSPDPSMIILNSVDNTITITENNEIGSFQIKLIGTLSLNAGVTESIFTFSIEIANTAPVLSAI